MQQTSAETVQADNPGVSFIKHRLHMIRFNPNSMNFILLLHMKKSRFIKKIFCRNVAHHVVGIGNCSKMWTIQLNISFLPPESYAHFYSIYNSNNSKLSLHQMPSMISCALREGE